MWQALMLSIRKAYLKHKLKKEKLKQNKNELANSKDSKDSVKVKKIKLQLLFTNIQLIAAVIGIIISVIAAVLILINTFMFIANIAGWHIVGQEDMTQDDEDVNGKNWQWDVDDPSNPNNGGLIDISGGIYPKDPILKNRAMIRQIFVRTAKDASASMGIPILPEYLFGVQIRETGGVNLFKATDLNKDISWVTSRLNYDPSKPICGKSKNGCSYLRMGHSHFVGGTVDSNLNDLGDPYTQKVNKDVDLYLQSKTWDKQLGINLSKGKSIGHAFGAFQWEIRYLDSKEKQFRSFPLQDEFGIDESSLPFASTRPNGYFYIPDTLYSQGWISSSYGIAESGYKSIVNSSEFKSLDERNQAFIRFIMSQRYYAGGWKNDIMTSDINALISLVKNNKVTHLDEMLDSYPNKGKFWNTTTYMGSNYGFHGELQEYIISKYSLSLKSKHSVSATSSETGIWPGVLAACAGKIVWDEMTATINAAEKEQTGGNTGGVSAGGQWIDYIGSGKFKPISTSGKNYYSQNVQATIYAQSSNPAVSNFMETSWNKTLTNTNNRNSTTTMVKAGCGVYTTAFCITNLTGTIVTPLELIEKGYVTSIPLPDNKVIEIARKYGLESYSWTKPKSDAEFESGVIEILKDGGLIVGVWTHSFPWYTGSSAHFMAIRGYDKNTNEFLVYTSAGANNKNFETVSATVKLPASTVRQYLSKSHTAMQVIKIKGGAGSITSNPSGVSGNNGMVWPLPSGTYHVTSLQGGRIHPITKKFHQHGGADIGAAGGTDIYAAKSGIVDTVNKWNGTTSGVQSWGNYVRIKHNDGTYTLYAHMSRTIATRGQTVNAGDLIGKVGTTGSSTGNHLHFELYIGGTSSSNRVDPLVYYLDLPLYMGSGNSKVYLKDYYANEGR